MTAAAAPSPTSSSGPIFISYARADAVDFAKRLHDHLEREGIDAWLDVRDIQPGDPWDESIWSAIEACSVFAFILTPGSAASKVCREEFERANRAGKRIAPILFLETTPLPAFYPPTMQYIDYLKRGEAATLAELRLTRDRVIFPLRSPEAIRAAEEAATAHALARPAPAAPTGRTRKPNPLPPKAIAGFRDRDHQRAEIHTWLKQGIRLIGIYGQGGVGKTSLAVEVLTELEAAPDGAAVPDLIVALRETRPDAKDLANRGISVEKIFLDTARALDGSVRTQLEDIWKAPTLDLPQKCAGLTQVLVGKRCILLIDNVEVLQDPTTHELTDPELVAFLEAVLPLDSTLHILITSRERVVLPRAVRNYEKLIPLAEGLATEDALAVLLALDDDGTHRLQNAPRPILEQLVARTKGYPRALEYLAALLKSDPRLTPDKLLTSPALLAGEVTGALAAEAFRRLPPDQVRVMEGLTLFGRPVSLEALQSLLAPYLDAGRIDGLLLRLMESYFVAYNPVTDTYTLHPIDLEYSLAFIPEGTPADPLSYTRYALLDRAAAYFRSIRKPDEEIARLKTLDALTPQFAEFEYLVALGDFNTAARVLNSIDFKYLLLWGHARRVLELHSRIVDRITDKEMRSISLNDLGLAYADLGQPNRAIRYYEQSLAIAREVDYHRGKGMALGNLGNAYRQMGQVKRAILYHEQALGILREIGDRQDEGCELGNLGNAYREMGQVERAIPYYKQRLGIAREIGDRRGEGAVLGNLGNAYLSLGQPDHAILYFEQALGIFREIGNRQGEGNSLGNLGIVYAALEQPDHAILYYEQALGISREIGNRQGEGNALGSLGAAYAALGQVDEALAYYRRALVICKEIGNPQLIAETERNIQDALNKGAHG